jgi:glycosyltransferase involved in cell wall biosynthesis
LLALKRFIEKEQIDIIHCHLFRSNVFGWLLKRIWFPKARLVIHEHGGVVEDGWLYRQFLRLADSRVDIYIAVSKFIAAQLRDARVGPEKIRLLYNFVDTKRFNRAAITWDVAAERRKLGIPDGAVVFGFAGRLVARKGWREFVEAAKDVVTTTPEAYFLVAGDGIDKSNFIEMTDFYRLGERLKYLGRVDDMPRFYSLVDCFVMPTHFEALGLTALEAKSMGIPLIVSDIPGVTEIIDAISDKTFSCGNPAHLAEVMSKFQSRRASNLLGYSLSEYVPALKRAAYLGL